MTGEVLFWPKADKSHETIARISRANQAPVKVFRAVFRYPVEWAT